MKYFIYHIFGKKIGVTRNLNKRVTVTQGYQPSEYEVLDSSDDIDYISKRELELQAIYGYKIDRQSYKQLVKLKQMNANVMEELNVNVTEQTTTFPYPLNKLKGNLYDHLNKHFETGFGDYLLTKSLADWIVENAFISMYNPERCYVYNKAMHEENFDKKPKEVKQVNIYDSIREWAKDRGIYKDGDVKTQYIKLQEESGELAKAILKEDSAEFIDAIGDMVVVLTNLAALEGLKIEDCIESAYKVIANRKGSMQNGTFVKNTL